MKLYTFTSNLIIADQPTVNRRVYSRDVCLEIKNQIQASYEMFDYSRALVYDLTNIPIVNGGFGHEVHSLNEVNDSRLAIGSVQYVEFTDRFIFHIADSTNYHGSKKIFNWKNVNIEPMMLLEAEVRKIDGVNHVVNPSFNKILMVPKLGL